MKSLFPFLLSAILSWAIVQSTYQSGFSQSTNNPPAQGFDMQGSDAKAIAIADEVMEAMGGREKWDNTRYLGWNFFGARKHLWDKHTGDVRIENLRNGKLYLMNINSMKGTVYENGVAMTDADSLKKYLKQGKGAWINDSYWLFMPFKLKDSGVTLKYVGDGKTEAGADADVLELTFKDVGFTPQNKYQVWVDKSSRLITQWAFYSKYDDEKARFTTPWVDYQLYGNIKLAGDRGQRKVSDISAPSTVDADAFQKP